MIKYYSAALVYSNLTKELQKTMMYGEGELQKAAETFQKCANALLEDVFDKHRRKHDVWIVSEPICTMCYSSDDWYFQVGNSLKSGKIEQTKAVQCTYILNQVCSVAQKNLVVLAILVFKRYVALNLGRSW